MPKWNNSSNKKYIKMTSMYNKIWKKQDEFFFIILVVGRSYLYEGWRLSNLEDIQTIWFHQLIVFFSMTTSSYSILFYNVNNN
jgi:hypothetical protein